MKTYIVNTDAMHGAVQVEDAWFERGIAVLSGPEKYRKKLARLAPGDQVLMYVKQKGLTAAGVVDQGEVKDISGVGLVNPLERIEYHRSVRWSLDLRANPGRPSELARILGQVPLHASQEVKKGRAALFGLLESLQIGDARRNNAPLPAQHRADPRDRTAELRQIFIDSGLAMILREVRTAYRPKETRTKLQIASNRWRLSSLELIEHKGGAYPRIHYKEDVDAQLKRGLLEVPNVSVRSRVLDHGISYNGDALAVARHLCHLLAGTESRELPTRTGPTGHSSSVTPEAAATLTKPPSSHPRLGGGAGEPLSAAVMHMLQMAKQACAQSGGVTTQIAKEKRFEFPDEVSFRAHVFALIRKQSGLCNLTKLPLQMPDTAEDEQMIASLDRIDSNGHYIAGNLQVVCRFVNRWKSDQPDAEFRRLLRCVQGRAQPPDR
jgi:hypothetical protein